jgi:hypothetical protein
MDRHACSSVGTRAGKASTALQFSLLSFHSLYRKRILTTICTYPHNRIPLLPIHTSKYRTDWSRGNALALYLEDSLFESWPGHWPH